MLARSLHHRPITPVRTGISNHRYDASATTTVTSMAPTNFVTDPVVASTITKIGQLHR
jgi:hypothetical protein